MGNKHDKYGPHGLALINSQLEVAGELKAIKTILDKSSIRFVVLKGPHVAGLYDDSADRTMSDIDLLVSPDDFKRTSELISKEGFRNYIKNPTMPIFSCFNKEALFRRGNGCWIELHGEIAPRGKYSMNVDAMIERSVPFRYCNVKVRGLNNNDLLLFLCAHIAKSYFNAVEKKHFKDIALLVKKKRINWEEFISDTKKSRMRAASYYVLEASRLQYDAKIPAFVMEVLRPSLFRRMWIERYLDSGRYPVYKNSDQKDRSVQVRLFLPLVDNITEGLYRAATGAMIGIIDGMAVRGLEALKAVRT